MIVKISFHFKINKLIYLWVIGCLTAFKEIEAVKRNVASKVNNIIHIPTTII